MKTLVAIPCMDMLHSAFAESLVNVTRSAPPDTSVCFKRSSLIYDSRNLLALTAIEHGFDTIMWFDSDMTFKPDTLHCLLADMNDCGYDLVSGLYVKRTIPMRPVLWSRIEQPDLSSPNIKKCFDDYLDYPLDTIFPIAGCGFGCVLVKVDLIKRVWDKYGPAFSPYPWCGEDISFCYRAGRLGAKMVCDSRVKCGHVGNIEFTEQAYLSQKNREVETDEIS